MQSEREVIGSNLGRDFKITEDEGAVCAMASTNVTCEQALGARGFGKGKGGGGGGGLPANPRLESLLAGYYKWIDLHVASYRMTTKLTLKL